MLIRFEWDREVEAENVRKNGLHFDTAMHVFADRRAVVRQLRCTKGVSVQQIVGQVNGQVALIVEFEANRVPDGSSVETVRLRAARRLGRRELQL